MRKKHKKKNKLELLDDKQQKLERRLFQAYSSGMSAGIIQQLQTLIDENRLELYNESELEKHRREKYPDGETQQSDRQDDDYIV